MKSPRRVSIVTRYKDEVAWLYIFLLLIEKQIGVRITSIVIVVNEDSALQTSSDLRTVISWFPKLVVQVVKYDEHQEYFPGRALNLGIREESLERTVIIQSIHVVPLSKTTYARLANEISESCWVAFGRQVPANSSLPANKRDLLQVFKAASYKTSACGFVHNAFAAYCLDALRRYPFSENVKHVEDWVWGTKLLQKYPEQTISYVSDATVLHFHGVNQHVNGTSRAKGVVRVLESALEPFDDNHIEISKYASSSEESYTKKMAYLVFADQLIPDQKKVSLLENIGAVVWADHGAREIVVVDQTDLASITCLKQAKLRHKIAVWIAMNQTNLDLDAVVVNLRLDHSPRNLQFTESAKLLSLIRKLLANTGVGGAILLDGKDKLKSQSVGFVSTLGAIAEPELILARAIDINGEVESAI